MSEEKSFYTVTEIAKRYEVTNRMVQYWITGGLLKAERFTPRSNYRITAAALKEFEAMSKSNN